MCSRCPNIDKIAVKYLDGVLHAMPLRCKSWGCDYCSLVNARKLQIAAAKYFSHSSVVLFATLTASSDNRDTDTSYRSLRRAWPIARQWIRRHYGRFRYLNIWELHKDGAFHLHGLWGGTGLLLMLILLMLILLRGD